MAHRLPLELDVLRDRSASFREVGDGRIENVYRLRVLNMDQVGHTFALSARGPAGMEAVYRPEDLALGAGEIRDVPLRIRVAPGALSEHSSRFVLELRALDEPSLAVVEESRFLGPRPRANPARDEATRKARAS